MAAAGAAPPGAGGGAIDHLEELGKLLLFVAGGGQPSRETAVDYLAHRSHLLASRISDVLPGFLYQCGTVDRFRDFIFLYDPDPQFRREFIERMIARARAISESRPASPPPKAPPPKSPIWDF